MNPALVYEGGKLLLKAIKTDDASSAESSSTVDVNQYGDTPMEIKRTEGDLGYDETPVQEETPQEHIDEDPTANPMEVKEVADISATDKPQDTLPQSEPLKPLGGGGGFSEIFSKDPDASSESFDDFFGNFLDEKENAPSQPVNYASTQGTSSSAGIPSGAPAIGSKEQSTPAQPLNVPKDANPFDEYQAIFDEFAKKDEPLLEQAEKAYEDDKDIDDKELPFVEDDKAAEDVEDVVQAVEEGSLDEGKAEEVLQEAADDGKIENDELDFDSFLKSVSEDDPNYQFSKALDERFGDNFQAKELALEALRRKFTDRDGLTDRKTLLGILEQIDALENSGRSTDEISQKALDFVLSKLPGSLMDHREELYRDEPELIHKFLRSKLPWLSDKVRPVPEEYALDQFGKLSDEEKEKLLNEIEDEALKAVDRDEKAKARFEAKLDAKNAEKQRKLRNQKLEYYKNPKNEVENEPDEEKIPQENVPPSPSPSINEKPQADSKTNQGKNEVENEPDEEKIPQENVPPSPSPSPSPSINEKPQADSKTNQGKNAAAPETPKDEEKKSVLATINGKLDEANDKWEKSPAKNLLDKGVKLGSIIYSLFKPKSVSASASSGETVALNKYEDENASTTSGGMGYDEEGDSAESTSSSGSAPSSIGSMSDISDTDYGTHMEQSENTRVASQAGLSSMESKSQKGATSSGSTSSGETPVKGSVKEAFNKILAQGAAYSPSKEGSSFESALGGGRIGSSGGVSGSSLGKLSKEAQAKILSEYEKIKQKVQATYKSWPKKRDLHVKEKGSVSVRTENGKEIGVKIGTRRQVSLESVAKNTPEKLRIVEEVI